MTDRFPAPGTLRRWPRNVPLRPLPASAWTRQPPTYLDARPALIEAAVKRAQSSAVG